MEAVNNQFYSNFLGARTNYVSTQANYVPALKFSQSTNRKEHSKNDTFVNGGIVAGSTLIGTATGYGLCSRDTKSAKTQLLQKLQENFVDLVKREKEGKATSFPHVIMLSGENTNLGEEAIRWTGQNSNCNFVEISQGERLMAQLREAGSKHRETGKRTLIHVKGFDQLLNPELTPADKIESLKSIMCRTAEDYHSTIIFNAKDPSKLDSIALQPHRVTKFDIPTKFPKGKKILIGGAVGLAVGIICAGIKQLLIARNKEEVR